MRSVARTPDLLTQPSPPRRRGGEDFRIRSYVNFGSAARAADQRHRSAPLNAAFRSPLPPFPSPLRSAAGERVRVRGLRPTTRRRSHAGPPHPTLSSTQTWRRGLPDPALRQLRQRCPSCRPTAPICVSARGLPFPSPSVPLSLAVRRGGEG